MQEPLNAFPPPTAPGVSPSSDVRADAVAPSKPASGGFDVLDVFLFFVGFFVFVCICVAVPWMPAPLGLVTGVALVSARHFVWPPKPRVARPYTTLVGVFVGLAAIASVLLLGFAGLGFVRLTEREPDWQARRAERLADIRSNSIVRAIPEFGDPASYEADYRRMADEEIARERQERVEHRSNTLETSLKLLGAGVLILALAAVAERARTRPLEPTG